VAERAKKVELGAPLVHLPDMKRFLLLGTFFLLGLVALATDDFWSQLTPEERAAAGLAGLNPEQRAALDRLAERYAREGARQAVTAASAQVREETKAELEKEIQKRDEARAGRTMDQIVPTTVRTRIAGQFKGWSGKTLFRLENGQVWVQTDNSDSYWIPPQPGPEVEVRQAGLGGWKLYVLPNERWVRVKRVN
jgi:hypothetical protein